VDIAQRLAALAENLYWTWQPELIELFRDLDPSLWRQTDHNPVQFLDRMDAETLEHRAEELALEARISRAFHGMENYLERTDTWGHRHAGPLRRRPVAYLSAEFGLHESLPLYAGGLGVLAGDHLKAASDLGLPLVGVGLFYARGYFRQRLDASGWQNEEYSVSDPESLPLQVATDGEGNPLHVAVRTRSEEIRLLVRTARVGRNQLVLLDSHVDGNSDAARQLTGALYGGGPEVRLRQELILGIGGLRALRAMGIEPGVLHLNEGHSTLAVLELARWLMDSNGRPFDDVREEAATRTVFTTHTPVEAGHDRFNPALVEEVLGPMRDKLGLSQEALLELGQVRPDGDEPFCMTVLGLKMARARTAVSARHGRIARRMWKALWPGREESEVPIGHVTNGVHVASWLAIPLASLYAQHLGPDWQERISAPQTWEPLLRADPLEVWEQHQVLKVRLIACVRRMLSRQAEHRGDAEAPPCALRPEVLTLGFARRFAPYKRAGLLLTDLDRLNRLVNHPQRPVQIIYAGKAHPADEQGKRLLQRVVEITRDERFAGKVVFVEDHDINVGRHLVQGVDVWLNTPLRPMEACGTSGQKAVMNGALHLSVLDGWWAEAFDGHNGFALGCTGEQAAPEHQDEQDAPGLYEALETQVAPLYYERQPNGVPQAWVDRQKHAIRSLGWRYNARRMVLDYATRCYLPAAGTLTCSLPAASSP